MPKDRFSDDEDDLSTVDHPDRKYHYYKLEVDPDRDDKALEILICDISRPHMRAFHASWWSFFVAFFIWFAIQPLLPYIKADLGLTKDQIFVTNIASIGGTIAIRFILGPCCDRYGARVLMAGVLWFASLAAGLTGVVNSFVSLAIVRTIIGMAGGTFVMCQYWTSRMFCNEIVGTANAIVGGWGNLGAGVTGLIMGGFLLPLFQKICGDDELAWRTVSVVPALIAFITATAIYKYTDDAPKGNYSEYKEKGIFKDVSLALACSEGTINFTTWILFLQYACCFGVELTMTNVATTYFVEEFNQSRESAAAIASLFGWMNLFARGAGGYVSDKANSRYGMRGRIVCQFLFLIGEAILIVGFGQSTTLGLSIGIMTVFSMFVQAAEGTTFAIVPYVFPEATGTVSGIVGAGGNIGAVGFNMAFRYLKFVTAFNLMSVCIFISALLSVFLSMPGYASMFFGEIESEEAAKEHEMTAYLKKDAIHRNPFMVDDEESCEKPLEDQSNF